MICIVHRECGWKFVEIRKRNIHTRWDSDHVFPLSLSLHFLNIRIHGIWRHVPEMELSRCIWRFWEAVSSETYKCTRCLFIFPSRSNFIWNKNEKLRIFRFHLFFKRNLSLFLSSLWNTNIKEYLKKKKKETFFHFLRSFIKKFYSLQFPITEFVRLRIS